MGETPQCTDGDGTAKLDVAQGLLGLVLIASGATKLLGMGTHAENFERWGYPQWFRVVTGGTETLAGLGVVAGLRFPAATVPGGVLTSGTMLGAVYTHLLRVDDPPSNAALPGLLLTVAVLVTRRAVQGRAADRGREDD